MVEVGIISRELGEKLSRAKVRSSQSSYLILSYHITKVAGLAQAVEDAAERANEVGGEEMQEMQERTPEAGRRELAARRYELMRDDDSIASAGSGERGGFMSRFIKTETMNICKNNLATDIILMHCIRR